MIFHFQVHSTFGVPFGTLTHDSTSIISLQSERARKIRHASLIVWDEAPMSPALQFEVVDRLLKDIMDSDLPFGGKPILLGGDSRQILPVVRRGTRSEIVRQSITHSHLWNSMQKFRLTRNMRAEQDIVYADWLLMLGDGRLPIVNGTHDCIHIPPFLVCTTSLIDFVYPSQMSLANIDDFARKVILCPRNDECRRVNHSILMNRFAHRVRIYNAIDTVVADDPDEVAHYPTEFLNSLEPEGLPPYSLMLKPGAIVMLIRNLDPQRRLCNGTRLVVTELRQFNFRARLLSGNGEEVIIPAIPLMTSEEDNLPMKMRRVQFPVRLSFAMTINKSQGQTFDRVGLLLSSPVFAHGQLYVAFSRVRNSASIRVGGLLADNIGHFTTNNIVYNEVLSTNIH